MIADERAMLRLTTLISPECRNGLLRRDCVETEQKRVFAPPLFPEHLVDETGKRKHHKQGNRRDIELPVLLLDRHLLGLEKTGKQADQ